MSVLSVTFHVESQAQKKWETFLENEIPNLIDNLMDVEKFIFSEVESDYVQEGKNYNLLLIFSDNDIREQFVINEMKNLVEIVEKKFPANQVMVFQTYLNRILHRF